MPLKSFGRLADGADIGEVTIGAGALSVTVITYGAAIRDLRLARIDHPLVLGFERLDDYVLHSPHFGAVAGRCANRIGGGRFSIDGRQYQVSQNENGRNHLHGGFKGFGARAWRLLSHDDASVALGITGADGEEGYPGNVEAVVRYVIEPPGTLRMEAEATADAPTLVNLAQHSYFNLDDSAAILDHEVQIAADDYTPTDADGIPTGEIVSVASSDFDFRAMRPIRRVRDDKRVIYDKNFVIDRQRTAEPRLHARLRSPKNGVRLEISSTEPGLQFYDGSWMKVPVPGLGERTYGVSSGCCFEPQVFPDAANHPGFPSAVLRPGETYRQVSLFSFSRT
jgi:aldose 1-epimerase